MNFRAEWILWLLVVAAVPVILHFLMRLRTRKIPWGANYLLERAIARARKEKQWLYYLLLALRCLLAAIVVFAFARPFLPDPEGENLTQATSHQVILLNDAFSTGYETSGNSLWSNSVRQLELLSGTWPVGTRYSIYVLAGGLSPVVVEGRKIADQPVSAALQAHYPRDGSVNLPESLAELHGILGGEAHSLWLLSSSQEVFWEGGEDIPSLSQAEENNLVFSGFFEGWNATVRSVELASDQLLPADVLRATVELLLSGQSPPNHSVVLEVGLAESPSQNRRVALTPGQPLRTTFQIPVPETSGEQVLRVEIRDADALSHDNLVEKAVRILEGVSIATPVPNSENRAFERGTDWLAELISAAPGMKLNLDALEKNDFATLSTESVLLCDDWAPSSATEAEEILAWVRSGGSLVIGGGSASHPEKWNPALLGGEWKGMKLLPGGGPDFEKVESGSFEHPALQALQSSGSDGLSSAKIFGYWEIVPNSGVPVVAFLENGSPFLFQFAEGLGSVTILSSGLGGKWNNLPVLPSFPNFLSRLLDVATMPARLSKNFERESGSLPLVPLPAPGEYFLSGPIGSPHRISVPLNAFPGLSRPAAQWQQLPPLNGVYEMRAVSDGGTESLLTTLDDPKIAGTIDPVSEERLQTFQNKESWQVFFSTEELARFLEAGGAGRELYSFLMVLVLLCVLAEAFVGRLLAR